jgi:hypothetical protein
VDQLQTLAEVESWTVAARQRCLKITSGRAALKAAMLLVARVALECCSSKGVVTKKRSQLYCDAVDSAPVRGTFHKALALPSVFLVSQG